MKYLNWQSHCVLSDHYLVNILRTRILNNMSKLWSKCFLLKYKTARDKFSSNLHRLLFIVVAFISILLIFEQFQKSVRNQQIMCNSHLFFKIDTVFIRPYWMTYQTNQHSNLPFTNFASHDSNGTWKSGHQFLLLRAHFCTILPVLIIIPYK